ncbi:DUF6682 family protein [Bacterioplanoides sp.]|uniref:phage adaptor protein n=1 Tax=Bacterioplanoides sp. TaxID=2066072 RepID=UPI003B599D56
MVRDIFNTVSFILSDTSNVTWTEPDLINALNNACRMVVICRPDACSTIGDVTLKEGAQQRIPDDGLRLIDTYYNESGIPIRMVSRRDVDRINPDWMHMNPTDDVLEVMYDGRIPDVFYVYPPAKEGRVIRLGYSLMPDVVNTADDPFPLPEKYSPAVIEWMLYQLFSLDSRNAQSQQQASAHSQQFYQILQVKTQADVMVAPASSQKSAG